MLEENNQLEPRTSGLDDDLEEMDEEDMDDEEEETETKVSSISSSSEISSFCYCGKDCYHELMSYSTA